jgi:hypothetical protein
VLSGASQPRDTQGCHDRRGARTGRCRRRAAAPAAPTVCTVHPEPRVHPGLSTRRVRERRAVRACGGLGTDGPGRTARQRGCLAQLAPAEPGAPRRGRTARAAP